MISEDIPLPGKLAWLGRDLELGFEHLLVLVVTRTQHDPVFAEGDRLLVLIGSDMSDGENRHCNPMILMDSMHFSRQEQGQCQ